MRFWPVLTICAACVCSLGAAGPETAPTYKDAVYGFSMLSPSFAESKAERVDVVVFQATPEDGFAANITVTVDPVKTTREEYVKNSLEAMKSTNPRATMRSINLLDVSGHEAESLEYDANMAGRRLRFLQLVVVSDNRVYIVTCTAPVDSWEKYKDRFNATVSSFRLDK